MTPDAFGAYQRSGANADDAYKILRAACDIDVRPLLSSIKCPTLVVHNRDDKSFPLSPPRRSAPVSKDPGSCRSAAVTFLRWTPSPWTRAKLSPSSFEARHLRATCCPCRRRLSHDSFQPDLVGHTQMMHRLGDDRGAGYPSRTRADHPRRPEGTQRLRGEDHGRWFHGVVHACDEVRGVWHQAPVRLRRAGRPKNRCTFVSA